MPDYDLSRLSARSFEQLVQALAVHVLGPSVTPFGDGPDGGREATFNGAVDYPSSMSPWNGYGVVQAKFRQRPLGQPKDTVWALAQLKAELESFVAPDSKRVAPEYYVFATSVALSSATGGGKDKATDLVAEFEGRLPIRGFALWDYDQLRALIDDAEDIRRSYMGWITSGDVLAAALERIEEPGSQFSEVVTLYVQRCLLADQYARLEQAGASPEDNIPLANVFVDLPIGFDSDPSGEAGGTTAISYLLDHAQLKLDPASCSAMVRTEDGEPGRFVLKGGPGQGKSTIAQFLCQLFRFAMLQGRAGLSSEVTTALEGVRRQLVADNLHDRLSHRFPVRVVLSDFATALAEGHFTTLVGYIADRMGKALDRHVSTDDLRRWLGEYPWALILDGLDEVPASSNRQDVLRAIKEFWIDASSVQADLFVLATTRPQGYNEDFGRSLYRHMTMEALEPAAAMGYARRLVETRYAADSDRQDKILSRLMRATENDATARLLYTPLQVTIMSTLVDRIGRPPQERWSLFNSYYDVIYQREVERDIPAASLLRDHKADIDAIHQWVGLMLQVVSEHSGGTEARLNTQQLTQIVDARLSLEGHADDDLRFLRDEIIEAAGNRLVFLVGVEDDAIGFELRSLQEFMAAEGLMAGGDDQVIARLTEVVHLSHWRNTVLFAAGKCFANREHLRDSIYTLCSTLDNDAARPNARASRAGARLAADILTDGPARRQPKYAQLFASEALGVLDLPADKSQRQLADLYQPSIQHLFEENLVRRLEVRTPSEHLGAWTLLLTLAERDVPIARDLIAEYAPESDDDRAAILGLGIVAGSPDFQRRLLDAIRLVEPEELSRYQAELDTPLGYHIQRTVSDTDVEPWQSAALHIHQRWSESRRLFQLRAYDAAPPLALSLGLVDTGQLEIAEMPAPHHRWAPIVAAAKFSANPTAAGLSEALAVLVEADFDPRRYSHYLPWPIAACLAQIRRFDAAAADVIAGFARDAASGAFGDNGDWKAAESRWSTSGITTRDISIMTDIVAPLPRTIADEGFPFGAAWPESRSLGGIESLYSALPASLLRSQVAAWLVQDRGHYHPRGKAGSGPTVSDSQLAVALREAADLHEYVSLPRFTDYTGNAAEICDAIEYAGRKSRVLPGYPPDPALMDMLVTRFSHDSTQDGIIRALADMIVSFPGIRLDRGLLPLGHADPLTRSAALVLLLASAEWAVDEAENLAAATVEAAQPDDWTSVYRAASAATSRRRPEGSLYLVELLNRLVAVHAPADVRADVLGMVTYDLQSFPSRLTEPGCLAELGFPDELARIVTAGSGLET